MRLFSKRAVSPLLALDLGASGAKCLLALPESSKSKHALGSLHVLASSSAPYPSNTFSGGEIKVFSALLTTCRAALGDVLARANLGSDFQPKDIILGFSGEQLITNISTVRHRRPSPDSPLSAEELDLLYKRLQKKAQEKYPALSLLDSRPLSLMLDGYTPLAPVGFKGEDLVLDYLTSFAPTPLVSSVKRLCSELGLYPLALTSNAYALARACLGPESDPDLSAILVDVGAATTTLSLIESGALLASASFSIAGDSFTHQISESLGYTAPHAERAKLTYTEDGALSDATAASVSASLSRVLATWTSALSLALEDFSALLPSLPPVFILAGGSALLPALQETLAAEDWAAQPYFLSDPTLVCLDPTDLPGFSFSDSLTLTPAHAATLGLLRLGSDIETNNI